MGNTTGALKLLAKQTEASLTIWQSPSDFQEIVEAARDEVGPYLIFHTPAWRFWREAWIIGRFALLAKRIKSS